MRILMMAGIFPPDIGGPANYIPKLSTALSQRGHRISVLCFSDHNSNPSDKAYEFPVHRIIRKQNLVKRELLTLWLGLRLARKSDLIYANGNDFKAWLIGCLARKPRVHKIVGDTAWERAQNRKWFTGTLDEYQVAAKKPFLRLLDWVRSFPLRQAAKVITPSKYLETIVRGWNVPAERIEVIYNSFQPLPKSESSAAFDFVRSPSLKTMCTVCRLVPWKGVDTLIRLLPRFPSLCFIVVGDGPLRKSLLELAHELQVSDRVFFLGSQTKEVVRKVLDESDFFILNSSYEGLPHVVLEAMSCQRLVLASAVGGTPELVKNETTGLLFPYNDLDAIQATVTRALSEDNQLIIDRASDFIEKSFSFERMTTETEKALQSAVESR